MTTIGDLLKEFPSSHTDVNVISNHFLRKYEEIHNCFITKDDLFYEKAIEYKKKYKIYLNKEIFRKQCSVWMNLPALKTPPPSLPLLSSSQIKLYFSTETLTNLSLEMVLLLMSKVHTVASSEDQRGMLKTLNEDTFRKLFYSLPRPVISTYSEKIVQGLPKPSDSNLSQSDSLQQSFSGTSDRTEGTISEENFCHSSESSSEAINVSVESFKNVSANIASVASPCSPEPSLFISDGQCQTDLSEVVFKCQVCKKTYYSKYSLTIHNIAKHSEHSGFQCRFCCRTFAYYTNKTKHEKTHRSDDPLKIVFKCGVLKLDSEINIHSIPPPVKPREKLKNQKKTCDVCKKTFSSKYTLYVHKKRHTLKHTVQCGICHKKLMRGSLRKHHQGHKKYLEKITQIESSLPTPQITPEDILQLSNKTGLR